MVKFMRPGKCAPLFADDVRAYDPRHPPSNNFNILTDIPPTSVDYELISQDACVHKYILKKRQTSYKKSGEPLVKSEYQVAGVCALCRLHLEVRVIYPKAWGQHGPFPHHLVYVPDASPPLQKMDKNPFRKGRPVKQEFHFEGTYEEYPVRVIVTVMEPLLSDLHVAVLTSVQRQEERTEAARIANPEKLLGLEMPSVKKTIAILRKYLENIIEEDKRDKLINAHGKTFSLSFGPEGEGFREILEYIGFEYLPPEKEGDCYLRPPVATGPSSSVSTNPGLLFLDNISAELFALQISRPDSEEGLYAAELFEWASPRFNDLLSIKPNVSRDTTWEHHQYDPAYYRTDNFRCFYDLGVLRNAPLIELVEGFNRQCLCDPDPKRKMHYMTCLDKIHRTMVEHEQYFLKDALEAAYRDNLYTVDDIKVAFEMFGFQTFDDITPSTEAIIAAYKEKLLLDPAAADTFGPFLLRIGDCRNSTAITDLAKKPFPTYQKALEYFGVDATTPDDFIISMFTAKIHENPDPAGEVETLAREALDVIAENRDSILLTHYLKTGTIAEPEMDVNKAFELLQIPHEADDSSIMAGYAMCCIENPTRVEEFDKALDVLSKDRGRDVRQYNKDPESQANLANTAPQPGLAAPNWPVGLYNIANTCYLNSLLQFYFTITPFRQMILNYPEYLTDLDPESIQRKKVGMRLVSIDEVRRSQRWIKKMSELFNEMITSPYAAVTPTKLLAALTLYRSSLEYANARRDSIASPKLPPAPAVTSQGKIDGVPIAGPLGPPLEEADGGYQVKDNSQGDLAEAAEGDDPARHSIDTEATVVPTDTQIDEPEPLVPKTEPECQDTHMTDEKIEIEHAENVDIQDGTITDVDEQPTSPRTAAQNPSDNISESQFPVDQPSRDPPEVPEEEEEDAEIPLGYGAQQDVTEVISNLMFQAQCAIKPEGFAPDGEQEDLVKSLFYGKTKTYTHAAKGVRSQEELFNDIKVNVASGPQSIYSALDYAHGFQTVSLADGEAEQYATLSQIPPILQIQVQRVQYDPEKHLAFKSNNHLDLKEVIYMDRYMDSEDEGIIARRRKLKDLKNNIDALEVRRKELVEFSQDSSVLDVLREAKEKIQNLNSLNKDPLFANEAIEIPDSTVTDISDLEARTKDEIDAINGQIRTYQEKIDHEFDDMQQLAYRLYAVFIHSGQVSYGHYWIYIFDFDKKIWRKYNDDYVTEVTDVSDIYKEDPRGIASPYFVVYVKDDLKESLVQPVVRDPVPIEEPKAASPEATSETTRESSSHIPSGEISEAMTAPTSMSVIDADIGRPPSRGRGPPPSYDDITPAGTHTQHHVEYSYAPSQCFYQDDVPGTATAGRSPAPVLLETDYNQPASVSGMEFDYSGARAAALSAANLSHVRSPAVSTTSKSSSNPFRQEPSTLKTGTGASPADDAIFGGSGDDTEERMVVSGAGTGMDADADTEWWNDDSGSK